MRLCYVDESGCTGALPNGTSPIQPVFVLAGVALRLEDLPVITNRFLDLKRRFFPRMVGNAHLDCVLFEVKGSDLRRNAISSRRREWRQALGFMGEVVNLLETHDARVFGRLWVKPIGGPMDGTAVYTFSVQDICSTFQAMLDSEAKRGFIIADSRNKRKNERVSHSIFTQKFRGAGDPFARVLEMPTFGHSNNHVGLQLADLLCSAFLFPMATVTYCLGHITSVHVQPTYSVIRNRFGQRLKQLQYRYMDRTTQRWRGGITVSDQMDAKPGGLLFGASQHARTAFNPPHPPRAT